MHCWGRHQWATDASMHRPRTNDPFFWRCKKNKTSDKNKTNNKNNMSAGQPPNDYCTTTYLYSTGSKIKGILEDIRIALEMAMSAAVPTLKYTNVPFVMSKLLMDNFLLP